MVIQSDPLSLRAYANSSPSSEKELVDRATVPSSERVFGSKKTSGSASREVWTYRTLGEREAGRERGMEGGKGGDERGNGGGE